MRIFVSGHDPTRKHWDIPGIHTGCAVQAAEAELADVAEAAEGVVLA